MLWSFGIGDSYLTRFNFLFQILAHAIAATGNVQIMTVVELVPYMEQGITSLLMNRDLPLVGAVATSSPRYSPYLSLVFMTC